MTDPNGSDSPQPSHPRVLCLGATERSAADLREALSSPGLEIVNVSTPVRALAQLATGGFTAVYADTQQFARALDPGRLLQNERILQGMPDGVVLLNAKNVVIWGNGKLREWTGQETVLGQNFYSLLGNPEILGPDFCPFHTAFASGKASASTLQRDDNVYFRVHAAPVIDPATGRTEHLVVTIRDISDEMLQQQKIAAIHQAGVELADLTTDEVAEMDVDERIDLLKQNILHCTQAVLNFDVVEIRMLNQETGRLQPLLAVGMKPEAEARELRADTNANGVTGFVAATGKSYLCEDIREDPLYIEGAQDARSSLTVPLMLHEQVIGTFNVESPETAAFSESDRQFLEIFARDLAVALNTLELLAAEKATTAAASVEAIHSAVAIPVDEILNDAVNVMERYIGHEPAVAERLHRILRNARDIKQVIQKVGQSLAPIEARAAGSRTEPHPVLSGKRVLVVDEDEAVRSAAHDLLERYLCVVETAHDGNEALYMVRNLGAGHEYDAILADIRLPDMSGFELLTKLQEHIDVGTMILMTGFGYDPGHSIVNARKAGLKEVLYKPFRLDQLLQTVERVLSGEPIS
ncbi:Response regulator MprA [Posidoniimonas corsicana]|uniref:Response regulator MprA n=1 Tax=Posidoniimonas corsicana TaxID=1938618 RepID=A0A5C5VIC4_9BACT|nr:Response regulator MprA [Posidoniimonas corsicana]